MAKPLRMLDLDLEGRRVLIREDLNVPIDGGKVTSDQRIIATLPTLRHALEKRARVLVLSHLGRPTEGKPEERFSLAPVARRLSELLEHPVGFERDWLEADAPAAGEVVLCENVRFNVGEGADEEQLARRMAALCDVFVMDAFGTAHRAQASTHGVAKYAPVACAGPLLSKELEALGRALSAPARPMLAVVGGAKVSTKLAVLESLSARVDRLIVGGGIANTFIAAVGYSVGRSLYEPDLVDTARRLMRTLEDRGAEVPIPSDVVVAEEISADAAAEVRAVDEIRSEERVLDVGPETAGRFAEIIAAARTIVWNGPIGVFEHAPFAAGTKAVAEAIARSGAFSIAGGGETLAAVDAFGVANGISYISTGGGAFLEYLEGRTLPAVRVLEERAGG